MAESSRSIDRHAAPPVEGGGAGAARWKTSERIRKSLEADREKAAKTANPWGTRRGTVPNRERSSAAAPQIGTVDRSDERTTLAQDDRIPAWLISMIIHMLAVLLLAFLTVKTGSDGTADRILMSWNETSDNGTSQLQTIAVEPSPELLDADSESTSEDLPADQEANLNDQLTSTVIEVRSPTNSPSSEDNSISIESLLGVSSSSDLNASVNGGSIGDRSAAGRVAAVEAGATTGEAEDAMELALKWIAAHQHNDGGWSFRLADEEGPCHGQCDNPIVNRNDAPLPRTAATGLALLAFMGAGNTHQSGPYADNIRRGIYYLRSQARDTTLGTDLQNGTMYGHGIATLALAEAYVLTSDPDLEEFLKGTTFFCASAQHTSGGWGYMPGSPPDITLTAWQVIAIKTAELRRIRVPTDVIPKAKSYVKTLSDDTRVRYGYKTPEPKLSTTAIGVLLQLYFGMLPGQTEIREALNWIAQEGPSKTNVYYNYYAMLAMHHSRHQESMRFARTLRDHLLATQTKSGHERGSWHFEDTYGSVGGRLYTTAMCVLILQTPYRYIPIHSR